MFGAIAHLDHTKPKDLVIYDRGYPSFRLIFEQYFKSVDFVIRAKKDFNNEVIAFYASGLKSKILKIYPGKNTKLTDKPYDYSSFETVRLVRVYLPNGQKEILITRFLIQRNILRLFLKSFIFKDEV